MGMIEIRDYALWAKHIHGDEVLKQKILRLEQGELIPLEIDSTPGIYKKMDDGKDGRSTPGLKGVGKARDYWHGLQDRRGDLISIQEA